MNPKEVSLRIAVKEFENSEMVTEDYMRLFGVVTRVLAQGDGLLWSSVQRILNNVLYEIREDGDPESPMESFIERLEGGK